ncbi:hypothetical protein AAC387_Pa12g0309 [Persea americana]
MTETSVTILSANSVLPNMYNMDALATWQILSSGSASDNSPKMSIGHYNLTDEPRALLSLSYASSHKTPNCELTKSKAVSCDSRSANTDLQVIGIPRMVPASTGQCNTENGAHIYRSMEYGELCP